MDVAAAVCVDEQADLEPDIFELMSSTHLEDKPLFFLSVKKNLPSISLHSIEKKISYSVPWKRIAWPVRLTV